MSYTATGLLYSEKGKMTATIYRPTHQKQINKGDPLGGLSCTAYSAAIAFDRATIGGIIVSGEDVREATGLSVAKIRAKHGLTLGEIERAALHFHIYLHDHSGEPFSNLIKALQNYKGVIAQGIYEKFGEYRCSSYRGGHAIYLNNLNSEQTHILVYDPLANAPRWIPINIISDFMHALPVGKGVYFATTRSTPLIEI